MIGLKTILKNFWTVIKAYIDGRTLTDELKTKVENSVQTSTTINGKALSNNISLSASDVGAATEDYVDQLLSNKADKQSITEGTVGTTVAQTPDYDSTFNIPYINVNSEGLVTGYGTSTVKIPATDNTNTTLGSIAFCSTAPNIAAKKATYPGFALASGQRIILQLVNTSTVANATLNVNGTGAKTIRINNANTTTSNFTSGHYIAYYDRGYWNLTKIVLDNPVIWKGTTAEYNALGSKDPNTVYIVVD